MATKKEQPIPDDLLAMNVEQLSAEEKRLNEAGLWPKLLKARDEAQAQLEAYTRRKRDVTRAIIAKLETRKK
jgi:hypothetical protein